MGKVLTPIAFWSASFKVKEVIEASRLEYFRIKDLWEFSSQPASLYSVDDGTFHLRLPNNDFVTFKAGK